VVHFIEAIVTLQNFDALVVEKLNLPVFQYSPAKIIGLPHSLDGLGRWAPDQFLQLAQDLDIKFEIFSDLELDEMAITVDNSITHGIANKLGLKKFALIQTEYHGGGGEQAAMVYIDGNRQLHGTSDKTAIGQITLLKDPINQALQMLGINIADGFCDEFSTVGLDRHRTFDKYFLREND